VLAFVSGPAKFKWSPGRQPLLPQTKGDCNDGIQPYIF
jgi:hypothetical protein